MKDMLNLETIAEPYKQSIELIREERRQIGLTTPDNIDVVVMFSNTAAAAAGYNSEIYVNPLANDLLDASKTKTNAYHKIATFFDHLRMLFSGSPNIYNIEKENEFFEFLYVEKDWSEFKSSYPDDKSFNADMKWYKNERKRVLSHLKRYACDLVKPLNFPIGQLIAHEIDHLDYIDDNRRIIWQIDSLKKQLDEGTNLFKLIHIMKENAELVFNFIGEIESRGIFFENFRKIGYNFTELDSVKEQTLKSIHDSRDLNCVVPYINYLCFEKAHSYKINDVGEVISMANLIHGLFDTAAISNVHKKALSESGSKSDKEIIESIIEDVKSKLRQYINLNKELVENIHKEFLLKKKI